MVHILLVPRSFYYFGETGIETFFILPKFVPNACIIVSFLPG
jgi:hypothetical protein